MEGIKQKRRVILHVDMNSFYASVEAALHPELRGKPLAIAGNVQERKGIIVTCSYEARAMGIKATMPLWQAKKLCPSLIVRPPSFEHYRDYSARMFDVLREFSSLVEPVSIDEGYVDITEHDDHPVNVASKIQEKLMIELQLPCSIGIAPNKFLAKTASDMKKPMGITILRKRDVPSLLWPLKTGEMHGIGRKTEEKLNRYGIVTVGDLAKADVYAMKQRFGINGIKMVERANGVDGRLVDPEAASDHQSVGSSTTLSHDFEQEHELLPVLKTLSEKLAVRLHRKELVCLAITITIRYGDRKTITRSRKLLNPVSSAQEIEHEAVRLFKEHWNSEPVRLLGVSASQVQTISDAVHQLDLFTLEKEERNIRLHEVMEEIKRKHGDRSIFRRKDHKG
ncbi:DNA polymerase IV [Fictibacillus iocasae]|uniref:DNA polymerase IV n=1 Tax=Fictibacillus iocasae TaxID=2715437 RepID=A0ABW2NPM6_9BACL